MDHFLGLPGPRGAPVSLLPVGLERSTSYGKGTAGGPAALLEASHQVESWDDRTGTLIEEEVYTAAPWDDSGLPLDEALESIASYVTPFLEGTFPLIIGGEHSLTLPVVKSLASHPEVRDDLSNLVVVHFDAHADMRNEYEGSPLGHACVLRRVHELGVRVISRGVRELSRDEAEYCRQESIWKSTDRTHFRQGLDTLIREGDRIYLTVDIDVLDASLVPATGTPVPGGLTYNDLMDDLDAVFSGGRVIGADVTEVASRQIDVITEFTAALLVRTVVARVLSAKTS